MGQWLWRARCKGYPGISAMGLWWGSILSLTHCLISRTDSLAVNIALPVLLGLTCGTTWRNGVPLGIALHVKQSFFFVLNTAGDLLQHVRLHAAVYCTPVWATMLPGSPNWLIAFAATTLLALDLGTQKSTSTATPEGTSGSGSNTRPGAALGSSAAPHLYMEMVSAGKPIRTGAH